MTDRDEVEMVSSLRMPMAKMVGLQVTDDSSLHGSI